jgi:hypothetical protein
MSSITDQLLARGWAFDAEGVLQPPEPSPPLEVVECEVAVRYLPPGGFDEQGWHYYRDVNGQIIHAVFVGG